MSRKYKRFYVTTVLCIGLVAILGRRVLAQTSTLGTLTDQGAVVDTQTTDPSNPFKGPYEVSPAGKNEDFNRYPYTNRDPSGMRGARPGRGLPGMGARGGNRGRPPARGRGGDRGRRPPPGFAVNSLPNNYKYEADRDFAQNQDPEMIKLIQGDHDIGQRARQLAQQIREGKPGSEGVDRKAELSKLVNEHFDVRQKRRELELKRLEEKLARLREVIKRRSDSRELIVGKRLSELLGEQYELDF